MRQKIIDTQFDIKRLYCNNKLIQTLLVFLLTKYITIRDIFDAQDDLDVDIILQRLQKKEILLKIDKITMWAKCETNRFRSRYQYRSFFVESSVKRC